MYFKTGVKDFHNMDTFTRIHSFHKAWNVSYKEDKRDLHVNIYTNCSGYTIFYTNIIETHLVEQSFDLYDLNSFLT
jgi:hypothetical protein